MSVPGACIVWFGGHLSSSLSKQKEVDKAQRRHGNGKYVQTKQTGVLLTTHWEFHSKKTFFMPFFMSFPYKGRFLCLDWHKKPFFTSCDLQNLHKKGFFRVCFLVCQCCLDSLDPVNKVKQDRCLIGLDPQWEPGCGWASQIEGYWMIWQGLICLDLVRIPWYLVPLVGNAWSELGQLYCYNVQTHLNTHLMCVFQAFMTLSSIIEHTPTYITTM